MPKWTKISSSKNLHSHIPEHESEHRRTTGTHTKINILALEATQM